MGLLYRRKQKKQEASIIIEIDGSCRKLFNWQGGAYAA